MARKVAANSPPQRRTGVNRAQLKALAARQAMTNIPTRSSASVSDELEAAPALDLRGVTLNRRRVVLTREQEFSYIRADLLRLIILAAILLAVMIVATVILR